MTHILIVDDNAVQQRILAHTLRKAGYMVTIAGDAEDAHQFMSEEPFDLAIIDIAMPDVDGIELLVRIREQAHTCELPVIMLTASSRDEDYIRAQMAGADAFLTKPTASADLLSEIDTVLGKC